MRKLMQSPGRLRRPQHLQPGADEGRWIHLLLRSGARPGAVLVTGGAGYIGSHAVEGAGGDRASDRHLRQPVGRAPRRRPSAPSWSSATRATSALLRSVIASRGVTAVMHFAAWAAVGESVRDPAGYYRNNVEGTLTVLRAMAEEEVSALHLLLDLRGVRRAGRGADLRGAPDEPDQRLRRDEAGGRAGAAALRAGLRDPVDLPALLQRGGRRSGRRARRGSPPRAAPDPARARGGRRAHVRCRCSATTTRRRTARACATTST